MTPTELAELRAGVTAVAVVERVVFGVPAWHCTCSSCPGWRCHQEAHDAEATALRCAQRHADRRHTA